MVESLATFLENLCIEPQALTHQAIIQNGGNLEDTICLSSLECLANADAFPFPFPFMFVSLKFGLYLREFHHFG